MPETHWPNAVDWIRESIVHIHTPRGSGTGFLLASHSTQPILSIATAAHVIDHEHAWGQPIRVTHPASRQSILLSSSERAIVVEPNLDTAAIVFNNPGIPITNPIPSLAPLGSCLRVGAEIGWLGFPAVAPNDLCFFLGRVSCWKEVDGAYLVDGVAINGVSGGPAFMLGDNKEHQVVGVLTAYIPNKSTGEPLPGLCVIRDIRQLQRHVQDLRSVSEAQASAQASAQQSNEPDTTPPQ